jgi:hypothetical protein
VDDSTPISHVFEHLGRDENVERCVAEMSNEIFGRTHMVHPRALGEIHSDVRRGAESLDDRADRAVDYVGTDFDDIAIIDLPEREARSCELDALGIAHGSTLSSWRDIRDKRDDAGGMPHDVIEPSTELRLYPARSLGPATPVGTVEFDAGDNVLARRRATNDDFDALADETWDRPHHEVSPREWRATDQQRLVAQDGGRR